MWVSSFRTLLFSVINSSFTSRIWCYGLSLGILFLLFLCHAHSTSYYIIPLSPVDLFIKIPSPVYIVCYLLDTVATIVSMNKRPFLWSDIFKIISIETNYKVGYSSFLMCYIVFLLLSYINYSVM